MILDLFIKNKVQVSEKGKDHLISLAKSVSWRLIGTIDTIIISYFITGQWRFALTIGTVEVFTKIILFYFHDRAWAYFKNKVWKT